MRAAIRPGLVTLLMGGIPLEGRGIGRAGRALHGAGLSVEFSEGD